MKTIFTHTPIKMLAISGSLRQKSSNSAFIKAIKLLKPENLEVSIYTNIAMLPFFNPDIAELHFPVVENFKNEIKSADGILIASPEYAHGITGVLKNALDWLVGTEEFVHKPVAIVNTSSRATHAYLSLREIVNTMTGHIIEKASLTVPLTPGKMLNENEMIEHIEFSGMIRNIINEFIFAITSRMENTDAQCFN